jgi:DNA-binding transcriptional LysR family regulator
MHTPTALRWDDLNVLLALARHSTLTAASKELGINHTTVARRLSAAEASTGARLFDRTPDGYIPTVAGEEVLAVAARVEEEILSLDRVVLGRDARLSGTLRVSTVDLLSTLFAEELGGFTRRYPGITLDLSVDNATVSLTRREADIAIRMTSDPPEHLVGRRIATMEYAVYGARSLVEELGIETPLDQFPWLAWDPRLGARGTERWMEQHVRDARIACRFDSAVSMLAAMRAGTGIQFMFCALGDLDDSLVQLREVEPDFGMDLWLLTHPDLRRTARVRAFMDYMAEALQQWAGRWPGTPATA